MTASPLSNLVSVNTLNVALLVVTGLSWSSPIKPAENPRRTSFGVDVHPQPLFNTQDLLSQFLSTLNLTRLRSQTRAPSAPQEPLPEFMLELYNRFTNDHTAQPSASIVRSFKNEDSSPSTVRSMGVRIYPLLFNISTPHHESITVAELRLFTLIGKAQKPRAGFDCKVTIYEKHEGVVWTKEVGKEVRGRDKEEVVGMEDLEELVTKHIHVKDNSWVSFDLTHAVTLWRKSGRAAHALEVHVARLGSQEDRSLVEIDIDRNLKGQHNTVLIVFSDDQSREHKQLIKHENDLKANVGQSQHPFQGHAYDKQSVTELQSDHIYDTPPRIRRSAKSQSCRRTPLFVDFKDIGWDSWIIQPLGYEAYKCNGVCNPPMTSEVSPTNHAIVQTLLSLHSPDRTSRACCVPTKLEPISLLYHDNGVITFNHKYEGMVVAECGCR
ncbi:bone morphogenetic protein 10-like [Oryzias melastigma]|uniref:Bone morphogenetic protein 10, like n=1 Tax=Oryzias melastigma TaxID=30732 RepID=A0A3B3B949_ORYME|nr:bone morphogenetic protein 10-like [Oryzias melastigma]